MEPNLSTFPKLIVRNKEDLSRPQLLKFVQDSLNWKETFTKDQEFYNREARVRVFAKDTNEVARAFWKGYLKRGKEILGE